jgi:outer membrane protein assembly factor BamB
MLLAAQASASVTVTAQDATPSAERPAQPARPRCAARPVSPAALVAILRQPAPDDPEADDPRGDVVPPNERAPLGDLIGAWRTCLASGDVPGLLGLFTANGIRRLLGERSPFVGGPAGLRISIFGISDVVRLPDGRIASRISVDPSGSGTAPPETLVVVIEQGEGGIWRIDHLRVPEGPIGAAGMPENSNTPVRPLLRRPIVPGPGVPAPAPGPVMPMRGGDPARTGTQPGPGPAAAPDELWRAPTGWYADAQPVAARGLVFFGGFSLGERVPLLEAVDARTGGIRWQTTAPVAWAEFPDAPALGGDVLYAPVQAPIAGVMAAVTGTGEPLWFSPFGFTSLTAPAVDADSVYVAGWGVRNARDRAHNDASGAVFALDQRTGRQKWRFLAPARFGPVAVGREAVFVPSDHGLYALDRATGQKRWQARFSPGPEETPTVGGAVVVFTGSDVTSGRTGIFALDSTSGALRWRIDLPAVFGARAGTAVSADTAFVSWWESVEGQAGEGAPTLRAYDLASGKERWVYRAQATAEIGEEVGVGAVTEPVLVGNTVLFGVAIRAGASDAGEGLDGLHAVDVRNGSLRWQAAMDTPIGSAPTIIDGMIFAMGGLRPRGDAAGGNLLAFGRE